MRAPSFYSVRHEVTYYNLAYLTAIFMYEWRPGARNRCLTVEYRDSGGWYRAGSKTLPLFKYLYRLFIWRVLFWQRCDAVFYGEMKTRFQNWHSDLSWFILLANRQRWYKSWKVRSLWMRNTKTTRGKRKLYNRILLELYLYLSSLFFLLSLWYSKHVFKKPFPGLLTRIAFHPVRSLFVLFFLFLFAYLPYIFFLFRPY